MDKDTFAGAAKQAAGATKEVFGKVIGDAKLQEAGKAETIAGKAESAVGRAEEKPHLSTNIDDFSISAALCVPLLSDNPTPLSSTLHIPTLLIEPKKRPPIK